MSETKPTNEENREIVLNPKSTEKQRNAACAALTEAGQEFHVVCPVCKGIASAGGDDVCGICKGAGKVAATYTPPAETPKRKPRTVAKKTIVMQMQVDRIVDKVIGQDSGAHECTVVDGVAWKDMTFEDFGNDWKDDDDPTNPKPDVNLALVATFTDTAAAKKRLKEALESGAIKGGTFRVAACGETMTPKVEPQQTNKVSF